LAENHAKRIKKYFRKTIRNISVAEQAGAWGTKSSPNGMDFRRRVRLKSEFLRLFAKILNNVTQKNPGFGFFQKTNAMRLSWLKTKMHAFVSGKRPMG